MSSIFISDVESSFFSITTFTFGVSIGINLISNERRNVAEKIIKYEIKLLSTKSVNPQFEKNLDKIIKKAFDSSAGKSLMSGSSYVGISQLKA